MRKIIYKQKKFKAIINVLSKFTPGSDHAMLRVTAEDWIMWKGYPRRAVLSKKKMTA